MEPKNHFYTLPVSKTRTYRPNTMSIPERINPNSGRVALTKVLKLCATGSASALGGLTRGCRCCLVQQCERVQLPCPAVSFVYQGLPTAH